MIRSSQNHIIAEFNALNYAYNVECGLPIWMAERIRGNTAYVFRSHPLNTKKIWFHLNTCTVCYRTRSLAYTLRSSGSKNARGNNPLLLFFSRTMVITIHETSKAGTTTHVLLTLSSLSMANAERTTTSVGACALENILCTEVCGSNDENKVLIILFVNEIILVDCLHQHRSNNTIGHSGIGESSENCMPEERFSIFSIRRNWINMCGLPHARHENRVLGCTRRAKAAATTMRSLLRFLFYFSTEQDSCIYSICSRFSNSSPRPTSKKLFSKYLLIPSMWTFVKNIHQFYFLFFSFFVYIYHKPLYFYFTFCAAS